MNYGIVFYCLGWVLSFEALFLVPPSLCALIYKEKDGLSLVITMLICLCFGMFAVFFKPKKKRLYSREGFVIVALSWFVLSLFGALPFRLSGYIPHMIDAVFETASGFTTTGASILSDVESWPRSLLFWRSFTHWIGGMGVLVFVIAILPLAGGSDMFLMKAESPGPSVKKLVPKVKNTAGALYSMYMVITLIEILFLLAGRMPLYESLLTAFGTAGTGGFGFLNDSMARVMVYQQVVITIFMILFGVNFNFRDHRIDHIDQHQYQRDVSAYMDRSQGRGIPGGIYHYDDRIFDSRFQSVAIFLQRSSGDAYVCRSLRRQYRRRY